jgi:hypothetical protein
MSVASDAPSTTASCYAQPLGEKRTIAFYREEKKPPYDVWGKLCAAFARAIVTVEWSRHKSLFEVAFSFEMHFSFSVASKQQ